METKAPAETLDRRAGPKPDSGKIGWIVVARHGEPDADRTVKITWRQYVDWWSAYNRTTLKSRDVPPEKLLDVARRADIVFASTLPRAVRTAELAAPGRNIITDPVF